MAQDFSILLGAQVNTKTAQQQIDKIIKDSSKRKINLEVGLNTDKSLSSFNKQMAQIENQLKTVTVKTREWTTAQGQLITQVEKIDSSGNTITQQLNQQADAYGNLTQKVTTYYKRAGEYNAQQISQTEQLITRQEALVQAYEKAQQTANYNNTLREAAKLYNEIDAPIKKTSTSLREWVDAEGKLISETRKFDNELGTTITRVSQFKNELGQSVTKTEVFDDSMHKLSEDTQIVKRELETTNDTVNKTASGFEKAGTHAMSLGGKILDATKKVAMFRISTTFVTLFYDAITEAKDAVLDFDAALTEFKKVSDLSDNELNEYTQHLGELGTKVARTRSEMVSASQEFVKSGFGEEQAAELAQVSEMFRNVVDEEISSAESAGFLVSMMKAYGDETTEFAEHMANAVDNVSNHMAVSSADIQSGLSKVASAFATTGNTAEESIALITSATEVMHGQANKVSRGWRTASATLSKMAESTGELEYSVNGVRKSISLLDKETGDFIGTYKTMQEVYSSGWQEMTNLEKASLALQIGSKTQMEVVLSTLNNFKSAEEALNLAINDGNAAWKENGRYMESIEAKLNNIKAQFQNLVLGEGGLTDFVKLILTATEKILEFANSGLGQATIKIIALATALKLLYESEKIVATMDSLVLAIQAMSTAAMSATTATEALALALNSLGINPVIAALMGLAAAGVVVYNQFEENEEQLRRMKEDALSSLQTIDEETAKAKEQIDILLDENATREELANVIDSVIQGYDSEGKSLDELNEKRAEALETLREYNKEASQDWLTHHSTAGESAEKNLSNFNITQDTDYGLWDYYKGLSDLTSTGSTAAWANIGAQEGLSDREALENIRKRAEVLTELQRSQEGLNNAQRDELAVYQEFLPKLEESVSKNESLAEALLYNQAVVDGSQESWQAYKDFIAETTDTQEQNVNSSENVSSTLKEIADQYGYTAEQIETYLNEHPELIEESETLADAQSKAAIAMHEEGLAAGELSDGLQTFTDYVSNLSDAYGVLSTAQQEYNETGGYSLETLNKLIPLMGQYGQMFDIVDGQIIIHTEDMYSLIEAEAEEQKSVIRGTAIAKLNALEQENSGKSAKESGDKHRDATAGIDENTASLNENTEAAVKNAQAQALQRGASKDDVENIVKEMQANIDLIDKVVAGMNTSFADSSKKAAKRASGSHKSSAKESKDAWLEAYKAEKDALESLYKTNVVTAEEYAQKLRELSDKYLTDSADHQKKYAKEIHDAYEAMYTALKKAAKEALDEEADRLKENLDALKDEKTARTKELKRVHEEEEKAIKKKIDAQKEYNKEVLAGIKKQIDALKREKDATKDGWDEKIKALKSEREEYERQVKLMQLKEQLAKAKATKQYVMDETGRFTYQEDSTAVDEAQENLIEEERKQQYERELADLEQARDDANKIYEERIQALEDYYDNVKEQQDKAIDQLEAYYEQVKEQHDREEDELADHYENMINQAEKHYNDFKNNADKYLNGQMELTNAENTEWGRRLQNLANFVNEYNRLMNELNSGSTGNSSGYSGQSSSGSKISGTSTGYTAGGVSAANKNGQVGKQTVNGKPAKAYTPSTGSKGIAASVNRYIASTKKRANGDASISADGTYLVGDSPNQELVIGSKLNGVPLSLSRGDGVVNAKSTKTLAGLFNMLGGMNKSFSPNTTSNATSNNITISNVSLPSVKNGEEFINYLQHFDVDMMQKSYDSF